MDRFQGIEHGKHVLLALRPSAVEVGKWYGHPAYQGATRCGSLPEPPSFGKPSRLRAGWIPLIGGWPKLGVANAASCWIRCLAARSDAAARPARRTA